MARVDTVELDNRFSYHAPSGDQPGKYVAIRTAAREFAHLLNEACPDSRELSLAITALEESVFWGNAAIARRSA